MTRVFSELDAFEVEKLGPREEQEQRPTEFSALRKGLLERAAQLRSTWAAEESPSDEIE